MKFNLTNVKKLQKESESELEKEVAQYIIDRWEDYYDKKDIITEVLNCGCESGVVSSMIYYSDTVRFYERHKGEINELLYNTTEDCGIYELKQLFGRRFDEEDPLCLDDTNKNLLAWFGFEETLRNIGNKFEEFDGEI